MKTKNMSWVMHLPQGVREQPGFIWIGTLCTLAGLSFLLGISQSNTITNVLDDTWLRVWGGFLFLSGVLVLFSTFTCNKPLERLSLRSLSIGILVYMGWVLVAIPLNRATLTVAMCLSLVGMAEVRVAVLKTVLRPLPPHIMEGQ